MKKLLITMVLLSACTAFAQTDEKETLKQLNQSVISLYKSQKYDEAAKVAQQAVNLNVKIYGLERRETVVAYTNLGVIYREKAKFKESVENLQKAADIYQKVSDSKSTESITAYETLGYSQFLAGKETEAEASYLKSLDIAQSNFGRESKESFLPTFHLASFYARKEKLDKADEFYLKTYALAVKNFGKKSKEIDQIDDSRICSLSGQKSDAEKQKSFSKARSEIFGTDSKDKLEVINGKAVSLPRPEYPTAARDRRLGGTASIKVKIDEQGNVIEAKSICRSDVLGKAAEEAALKAKFSPTSVDGKPVQVTGIITYNFIL